ncbi:hypothetical protein glysoja_003414 [Glycine soja]|nr:hypothetical protein glysoja_003414 [Glycine soja]
MGEDLSSTLVVREFDLNKDRERVEAVERSCEVGPSGKLSLFTDMLGDPICRVRHSPAFLMLVAEIGGELVGMIRGCIKTVTCGKRLSRNGKHNNTNAKHVPVYTKVAYILGLRVSPNRRRMGIGLKLVRKMETWFRDNGTEYSYMTTEKNNLASVKLFTDKCGYSKFRNPSILVNPVFAHPARVSPKVRIISLSPSEAEVLYRHHFATTEFFPRDVDSVLNNKLNLGTFLAVPNESYKSDIWLGPDLFLSDPPHSWAMVSVWNSKEVFTFELRGASRAVRVSLHFLGGEGPEGVKMVKALCGFAHNLAMEKGCRVLATEVSPNEPLRFGIPHWKMLSGEDLWCMKRLGEDYSDGSVGDWTKSQPGMSIFVDPREV